MCVPCFEQWTPVPAPVSCGFCGEKGSARTCYGCSEDTYLDGLTYYLPYGNVVLRKLLTSWKYHGDRDVEDVLSKFLMQASVRMEPPVKPWVVTHVPLHGVRLRTRGFDQAQVIAMEVGGIYGVPVVPLLQRVHKTMAQARQQQRQVGEMDGVFEVVPGVQVPKFVLLCDDVFTSGATMDAAAKALKEAGVEMVWGFVLGKGA
ncbi:MAG: hypothetical protein P8J32_02560 [bacterium]|nr:hypothetical protein [bacterium]